MYKVFFNNKLIKLTTELSNSTDEVPLFFIKYISAEEIIRALKSKIIKQIKLYHSKEEKLMMHFNNKFKTVEASGGLVKNKNNCILFIYRNNKWDLPKGKIRKSESIEEGALREVVEETGIKDLKIKNQIDTTYHIYKGPKKHKIKKTYWFLMESDYLGKLKPQIQENITLVKWIKINEIPKLLEKSYKNIKRLMNKNIEF